MNKYIRLILLSAILGLCSFIPLSYAGDTAPQKGEMLLASLALHSYEGVCCGKGVCCGSEASHAPKAKKVHYKHHHKHKHKKHKKKHTPKCKPKPSCGCQYS